jgi:catechol 2,3-dioxygenase-like lactoylglutathione lyase family enzyme
MSSGRAKAPVYDAAMTAALDHVQLAMPAGGEEAARGFYHGLLGLAEVEKPESLRAGGGVWFEPSIHLGVEADFRPARKAHPGLRMPDLDGVAARLARAGVEVQWDERLPGVRRFYVHDPFGNRIELLTARDATADAAHRATPARPARRSSS